TGLPECADDTVTDYSRPSPTIESTSGDDQNRNSYTFENGESTDSILSKSAAKFVKAAERPYIPPMRTTRPNTNAATRPYVNSARPQTTQELMIILIQRVQRLKRELKARTPIHKVDRGRSRSAMAWVPKKKLDCRCNIKFRGGMLGIKCSKIFPLLVMNSHCKKKFPLLEEVPTARVILPLLVQKSSYYMDLFSLISALNPTKVKTRTHHHAAHEVPLLTTTAIHVIDMEDTAVVSGSSRIPSALEKSPLDFADEDPPKIIT
nr:hypothetical protein [Tanacetum cinerariifolium]